ncbi:MAG TPA: glycosyltransferase family 2 protein [Opitutaceae bacterium]|nr:glycosyltransferase family 2 protein [Lacunisphaera sp.]HWA10481.1 glycosyltransferase family 2 protein [Opitutaceae bacterium]
MPLVSIILPTCDRPELLARAVASVFAQSGADWELLLVDNNRREPPLAEQPAARPWLADSRVRLVRAASAHNAASARNAGLAAARGEWISYLDDDDAYRPGKLAAQLALARASGSPLVLCGATFHLRSRQRRVQCSAAEWRRDELILHARWNTPLLFHRHPGAERFDEQLSPGEDAEFAHRLLAQAGGDAAPVVPQPLVDIHPQPGPRVNSNPAPVHLALERILALRPPDFYSPQARRRFRLQGDLAVAKLTHRPARCAALGARLLWASRGADWRPCANAMMVSLGLFPGRWVS